jgi:hypothetical protein
MRGEIWSSLLRQRSVNTIRAEVRHRRLLNSRQPARTKPLESPVCDRRG